MMRFLSSKEALAMIRIAGEYRRGERALPPEIAAKRKELADETRNAELFLFRMNQVDYGMVARITKVRLELDALYAEWAVSEAA
jgi:hypothetical protein